MQLLNLACGVKGSAKFSGGGLFNRKEGGSKIMLRNISENQKSRKKKKIHKNGIIWGGKKTLTKQQANDQKKKQFN